MGPKIKGVTSSGLVDEVRVEETDVELKNNSVLAEPLCVSVPTAARMLGVSRNTGYEMARLGQIPTIRCGRRRLVVPKAALEKMLNRPQSFETQ